MVSVVERIRTLNPKLNAIVMDLTEQALAEAATADRARTESPGPLFGVPVTIKVNVDQEGQATTNGLPALANLIAPADAPIVRNLRRAGAIIVGRTNTPELSMRATTVNPLHGRTWNPWHPDASPGGSSGGDVRDPGWMPAPFDGEPLEKPIRVAVTHNAHGYKIHPGIVSLIERAAGFLSNAGYDVVAAEPPSIMEPARGWFTVLLTELKGTLGPLIDQFGSDDLRRIFGWYYEIGKTLDLDDYRAGLADRTRMMRAWNVFLDAYPLVLTPFLMRPMYSWNYDAEGYAQTKDLFDSAVYSYGINYLGLPAGFVPVDLVEDLPAGVQLVGRRFREDVILDAMAAIEQSAGSLVERLWAR